MKKKLLILCLAVAAVLALGSMGVLAADDSAMARAHTALDAATSIAGEQEINDDCSYTIYQEINSLYVYHTGTDVSGVYTATFTDEEIATLLQLAKENDLTYITLMTDLDGAEKPEAISIAKASMDKLAAAEASDGIILDSIMMGFYLCFHEIPACSGEQFVMGIRSSDVTATINFVGANNVDAYVIMEGLGNTFDETTVVIENVNGIGTVVARTGYDEANDLLAFPVTGNMEFTIANNNISFNDIAGKWFEPAVKFVAAREIMNGMDANSFSPDTNLTRAMMVTMLYRLEREPEVSAAVYPFDDVSEAYQWAQDAILWAAQEGIAMGMTDTTFGPERNLTREQAATFIYRYCTDYLGYDGTTSIDLSEYFTDASQIGAYAQTAMAWCAEYGIMEGIGSNQLSPLGTCTRAQMATIFTRVINVTI